MEFGTVKYGHLRKWLHFRGGSDYVELPSGLVGMPHTIVVFFEPYETGSDWNFAQKVFSNMYEGGDGAYKGVLIQIRKDQICYLVADSTRNLTGDWLGLHTTYEAHKKYLVAGVLDESKAKLYVNGNLITSVDSNGFTPWERYTRIGANASFSTPARFFNGKVYSFAYYNRALSDAEISQMYDYVANGEGEMITDGLVLWYDGDSIDMANGIWRDKSGNGNDGTIYGAIYNSNWGTIKYGTIHYGA